MSAKSLGSPSRPNLDQQQLSRAMFTPSAFLQGQLLFEYLTNWEPYYAYLEDFQHWRKLYAIIAVEDTDNFSDESRQKELELLKNKYKTTLVQRVLPSDSTHPDIKSFVLELSTRLLLAISEMVEMSLFCKLLTFVQAQAIQALPTLRSPMDPSSSVAATATTSESTQELKRPASVGPGGLHRTLSSSSIKHANRNSVTASQNASSENLVEKRGTSKGRGRVLKVLGDLSLLCGIVPGAITSYIQSVEILRLTTDYIWHASALEGVGMALVLLSYLKIPSILQSQLSATQAHVEPGKTSVRADTQSTNDLSTDPFPNQSLLDVLPDTHSQILSLYQRSMGPSSVDPIPPVCFSDNIIRLARLLCDVYATGDLGDVVLEANVLGIPVDSRQSTPSMYPPRGEIARWAMRAWGPHLAHDSVPMSFRIQIIAALVHIMGTIGFLRKRATLLNEMLHLFIPQLVQARVVGASESGLHPNAAQNFLHQTTDDDGLVSLMDSLIKVYGVGVPLDDRRTSGWPSLRTHILRECIAFCDALPHPAGVAHFTSLLFTVAADGIEKDEQIRLAGNLPRIVGASKKRGKMIEADYWDMFVVQNIEILKYYACLPILIVSIEQQRASFGSQQQKSVMEGKEMVMGLFFIVRGQRKASRKRRYAQLVMYS